MLITSFDLAKKEDMNYDTFFANIIVYFAMQGD